MIDEANVGGGMWNSYVAKRQCVFHSQTRLHIVK